MIYPGQINELKNMIEQILYCKFIPNDRQTNFSVQSTHHTFSCSLFA